MLDNMTEKKIPDEDRMRADLYDYLGVLLARPPSKDILRKTATLTGDDTDLGKAIAALAQIAAKSADDAGGKGVIFNNMTIADGISMGTPGMRYSLSVAKNGIETLGNFFKDF